MHGGGNTTIIIIHKKTQHYITNLILYVDHIFNTLQLSSISKSVPINWILNSRTGKPVMTVKSICLFIWNPLDFSNLISFSLFVFPSIVWSDGIWQLAQSPLLKRLLWSVWEADKRLDYNIGGLFLPVRLSSKYHPPSCKKTKKTKKNAFASKATSAGFSHICCDTYT